jgi:hypothetical protein
MDFMENPKYLVRINGTHRQIVIRVAAIIEMETAQDIFRQQPCDNLFDVLRRVMMTGIY